MRIKNIHIKIFVLAILFLFFIGCEVFAAPNIEVSEKIDSLVYSQKMFDGKRHSQYDRYTPQKIDNRVTASSNIFIGFWEDSLYQADTTVMCTLYNSTDDASVIYKTDDLDIGRIKLIVEAGSVDKVKSVLKLYGLKGNSKTELSYTVSEVQLDRYSVYVYEVIAEIDDNYSSIMIFNSASGGRLTSINAVEFYSLVNTDELFNSSNELQLLWGLGAVDGSMLTEEKQNSEMYRSDFAKAICVLLDAPKEAYENAIDNSLVDITSDIKNAGCVNYLTSLGYMDPLPDGSFHPEKPLTYQEAVKTTLRVLGYESFEGIIDVRASEYRKLLKGISSTSDNITVKDACLLLFNMLDSKYFVYNGNGLVYSQNSYMTDKLKIYKSEGQISQTKYGSISQMDDIDDGEISINGTVYKVCSNIFTVDNIEYIIKNERLYALLGYNIDYYYRINDVQDTRDIVSYYFDDKNYAPVILDNESIMISESDNREICYFDEKDKKKRLKINISNYIVNGERLQVFSVDDIYNYHDRLIFFDGNRDGIYETVFIYDFDKIVADRLFESEHKVRAKNKSAVYDFDEDLYTNINYIVDGITSDFTDIKSGYTLSIAAGANKDYCTVFVSTMSQKGEIRLFNRSDKSVEIGTKKYKFDKEYYDEISLNNFKEISLEKNGTFYLDHLGKIVYFDNDSTSLVFGYLVAMGKEEKGVDETIKCRIVTDDLKDTVFICNNRFKIQYNGISKSCAEFDDTDSIITQYMSDWGKTSVSGLVKYRLSSEGKIIELHFPAPVSSDGVFSLSYKNDSSYLRNQVADYEYSLGNAKIFIVPSDVSNSDKYFNDIKLFDFYKKYNIEIYDADDMNDASALVCYIDDIYKTNTPTGANVGIITECYKTLDEEGNERIAVSCLYNGTESRYMLSKDLKLEGAYSATDDQSDDSIKKGTVIRFIANDQGDICRLIVAYNAANGTSDMSSDKADWNYFVGKVIKTNGKYLISDDDTVKLISLTSAKVYIYDTNGRETVTVGVPEDIIDGDKIISFNNHSSSRCIVIIR